MGIILYTSRVILHTLGVKDYGVYSIVGGVITLFSFFNSAMTSATQRFLSFDIGRNDAEQLKKTFNATLNIHLLIGVLILLLAETLGVWFINNKINLPLERVISANWVYHFSVFTFFIGIIQVPYDALLVGREKMQIYAIMSFMEVVLKLIIAYLLVLFSYDKLILYSGLLFFVAFITSIIHISYCKKKYLETKYEFYFEKDLYEKLITYSGWSLFGSIAAVARGQGINIILNLFFGTAVNAAYGITLQVQSAVGQFVSNFQLAVNPQIIKNYAQGNIEQSKRLIFQSAKFSYFLIFIIALPVIYNIDYILKMWLENPPPYTSMFVVLSLVGLLIDCISGPLMTGSQAAGNIKWYQIVIGSLVFLCLPMAYFFLKIFKQPASVFYVIICINIVSLIFRLFFLKNVLNFNISFFLKSVLFKIIRVTVLVNISSIIFFHFLCNENLLMLFIIKSGFLISVSVLSIYAVGLEKQEVLILLNIYIHTMKILRKIIKQIFGINIILYIINFKDLLLNFIIDCRLYYNHSNVFKIENFNKKEAKVILNYHSIEKGFLYKNRKARFAQERVKNLHIFLHDKMIIEKSSLTQIRVAYQIMCEYYELHIKLQENILDYFNSNQYCFYKKILLTNYNESFSSTISYNNDEFYRFNENNFFDFSSSRRSVRDFTGELIDLKVIEKAISLALTAPSVCNRQTSKVYLLEDQVKIDKVLTIQNGFTGHTKNVRQLLIVTANRNYFFSVGERNQFYIDGGIFLMNLLYSLHYYRIAHCPANWGKTFKAENKLFKIIKIQKSEKIICMIPIGIAAANFNVTLSQRRDFNEIFERI
ncbi:nitroreductase family protein [Flavobacterium sp. LAR06]|uniref:nitroreductase family protein n=1 Tax=Flavobacterium sp. LAR06 TaxID=3064897 RepID=UPI0035C220F3